jgi:large subunit ribosomal protein L29
MKIKEIRDLSTDELNVKERTLREELFKLRLRQGVSKIESPAALGQIRRDIARVRTVLRQREEKE